MNNEKLIKERIAIFRKEKNEANFINLLGTLSESNIWIPCNVVLGETDQKKIMDMVESKSDDIKSLIGETFTNQEQMRLVPDILKNGDNLFFPVFTTIEEMGEYGKSFSKMEKKFLDAINLAKNNDKDLKGIIINPFSDAFFISPELYDIIKNLKQNKKD